MTDPDWEPVMKRAAAIVTRRGGRTCHAAIIARELGVPAVVGCGESAADIRDGQEVTVSCAEGDTGFVYDGALAFEERRDRGRRAAAAARTNHDERRQSRSGVRLRRHPERWRRARAPRVHHQPDDRRASEGVARLRPPRRRRSRGRAAARWRVTRIRSASTSRSSAKASHRSRRRSRPSPSSCVCRTSSPTSTRI